MSLCTPWLPRCKKSGGGIWPPSSYGCAAHGVGYTGDGFYRSKDPTNSIKVLKEKAVKENNPKKQKENTNYTYAYTHNSIQIQHTRINTAKPLVYTNMGWLGDGSHRGRVARPERRRGCRRGTPVTATYTSQTAVNMHTRLPIYSSCNTLTSKAKLRRTRTNFKKLSNSN